VCSVAFTSPGNAAASGEISAQGKLFLIDVKTRKLEVCLNVFTKPAFFTKSGTFLALSFSDWRLIQVSVGRMLHLQPQWAAAGCWSH
jgi:hypothetical protein